MKYFTTDKIFEWILNVAVPLALAIGLLLFSFKADADSIETFCCDRAAKNDYLFALKEMGVPVTMQNFTGEEFDATAQVAFNPNGISSVYSRGITYMRTDGNYIRTTIGTPRAVYGAELSGRHPKPEGFTMVADAPLYGFCGYFNGHHAGARFELDGNREVDFDNGDNSLYNAAEWRWLCFTDTNGFQTLRVFNTENPDERLRLFASKLKLGGPFTGMITTSVPAPESNEPYAEDDEQVCEWNDEDSKYDCEDS